VTLHTSCSKREENERAVKTHARRRKHTCIHSYIPTHTYTLAHTRTDTLTHLHTYTQIHTQRKTESKPNERGSSSAARAAVMLQTCY
jgi:hypothetical protein